MHKLVRPFLGAVAANLVIAGAAAAQTPTTPHPEGPVTVVVEVRLSASTRPAEALVAINDMRAMMHKQPGFLSEIFLQNLNPDNAPRYVHVSRWASMALWAALFGAPQFAEFNAHGNEHYTINASAYLPVR